MNEDRERIEVHDGESRASWRAWLIVVSLAILLVAGFGIGYGYRQQATIDQLNAHQTDLNNNISQMQSQVNDMTSKMEDMAAKEAAAEAALQNTKTSRTGSGARRADDPRFKKLQSQLDNQGKQLQSTQDDVSKTRTDLEASLGSTRDELNGSIARTHDELVDLEKKGERNYYEFDLKRAKTFQHAGPVQVSLRKADVKHKRFDLEMIVDDNELSKKSVNLYEPIWIHRADDAQPVQIVVNKIDKDHIHGYISEPKYRQAPASSDPGNPDVPPPVIKQDQ